MKLISCDQRGVYRADDDYFIHLILALACFASLLAYLYQEGGDFMAVYRWASLIFTKDSARAGGQGKEGRRAGASGAEARNTHLDLTLWW